MIEKIKKLYSNYKEIVNYLIIGVLTTVVSLASFYLIRIFVFTNDSQFDIQLANVISWVLAVLFAFVTNKKYVFGSKSTGYQKFVEMIKFYVSRLTTLGVEMFVMWLLTSPLKVDDMISKIIVQFIIVILNYVFSKLFVFKKKH